MSRLTREELRDLADTAFMTMNWARRLGFGRERQLDEVVKAFEVQLGYRKPAATADEVAS